MTARVIRRSRTLAGVAAVAAVIAFGMTTDPAPAEAAIGVVKLSSSAALAPSDASAVRCWPWAPGAGWIEVSGHMNPNGCQRCADRGRDLEKRGFKVFCEYRSQGAVLWRKL